MPFAWLLYGAFAGGLGPDPAKTVILQTGEWALRFLLLTLAVSPLRRISGWYWPMRLRRMLGLFAFFYACVHLASFCQFYTGWDAGRLLEELAERPYITVGALAWVLLLPLAITSTHAMQRRLGRNWRRLHRLVYPALLLACVHLAWQVRSDYGEALVYGVFAALLLGYRWFAGRRSRQ
ncbi:sulfoxide reductase heme-binding subunit YedZ [Mangrovimicrobium sediminis]|uniref:Protein-methionine-sulfoxide reductase heme-binding subunit MsrQ n=2 Tax=Mangrovimicrobium sediminis TaxID=2562682 RepID=A0A4Z0LWP3_9GAMM|nr:sulfoxide reductase heme-binding subunit YedZ [Haliea sp. SAOS-164]